MTSHLEGTRRDVREENTLNGSVILSDVRIFVSLCFDCHLFDLFDADLIFLYFSFVHLVRIYFYLFIYLFVIIIYFHCTAS